MNWILVVALAVVIAAMVAFYVDLQRQVRRASKVELPRYDTGPLKELATGLEDKEKLLYGHSVLFEPSVFEFLLGVDKLPPVIVHSDGIALYANDAFRKLDRAPDIIRLVGSVNGRQRSEIFHKLQSMYTGGEVDKMFYIVKMFCDKTNEVIFVETHTVGLIFQGKRSALTVVGDIYTGDSAT